MNNRKFLRPRITNSPCWKAEMATADATNQRSALLNSGATAAPVSRTITRSRALSLITFGPHEDPDSLHAGSEPGEKKTAVEKLPWQSACTTVAFGFMFSIGADFSAPPPRP